MAETFRLSIVADLAELAKGRAFVEDTLGRLGASSSVLTDMRLAVDEALTNIILHGYAGAAGEIEIEIGAEGDTVLLYLRDHAAPFDPSAQGVPEPAARLQSGRPGGYGLYLIRHMVDEIRYQVTANGGNEFTLVKRGALPVA